jgi:dienelactone hydrolase
MDSRASIVILLVGLAVGQATATGQGAPPPDDETLARIAVSNLIAGRFDLVEQRFSTRMQEAFPAERLGGFWNGLIARMGPFRSITGVHRSEQRSLQLIYVTCEFARGRLDLLFAITPGKHIGGIRILPAASGVPWEPPAYADPKRFVERAVTVGKEPWALPGTLTLPQGKGRFPVVVLVHGSGPQDENETIGPNKDFKDLAWGLATRGIAVLRYTKRTHQYGAQMKDLPNMTVKDEVIDDARAAVALAARTPGIDNKHIYLAGHSLGGYLAPRIAAGDRHISGLIILAGPTRPMEDVLIEQLQYQASLTSSPPPELTKELAAAEKTKRQVEDPNLKPGTSLNILGTTVPASYFLDLRDYHPGQVAASLKIPMLILQGQRDSQVRMADFEGWQRALAGRRNITFKTYPQLNHLFMAGSGPSTEGEYLKAGHVAEVVIGDIAAWVLQSAGGKPSDN